MAILTVTGEGALSDDTGQGEIVVLPTVIINRVLFYRTTLEERLSILEPTYTVSESAGAVSIVYMRQIPRGEKTVQFGITLHPVATLTTTPAVLNVNYTAPVAPYTFAVDELSITKDVTILNTHMGPATSKTFRVKLAVPPTRNSYIRGPASEALVTITGVT